MKQTPVSNKNVEHIKNRGKCMRRKRRKSTRRLLVGSPVGDREMPEQQGHQCCREGVRCGGVGERAIAGERERMGGRKEEKEKKKGGGRPARWGANQLAIFKNKISNVWHSATLETTNVAHMPR
jgi:hypothetical protein